MVQLHSGEPSALKEALRSFTVLEDSTYANKHLGSSGQLEVMTCECGRGVSPSSRSGRHSHSSTPTPTKSNRSSGSSSKSKRNSTRNGHALDSDSDEQTSTGSDDSDTDSESESVHRHRRSSRRSGDDELCGANSNCVNRLTYMECWDDFCCDVNCANRRFQRHEHARVDVFKAGKKGFGVRALEDIPEGAFIYEYTGEVLDEARFVKRQQKYDREGVEHFYFMMLQKDEFIDATEKGSIARFCNHSCNPNAQIEKWIVGPKLRMGLFAKRDIQRGEEICFDYKVDRYGSKAQPCYCGEPNCSGFLGGRTQTGGTLLPPSVVEGLGLDSDTALSWPESALQKLQQHASALGLDPERVLNRELHEKQQPKTKQEEVEQLPPLKMELDQPPLKTELDQSALKTELAAKLPETEQQQQHQQQQQPHELKTESPSGIPQPVQPLQPPEQLQQQPAAQKKRSKRGKNKAADLLALLDAPPSSLDEDCRTAQKLLLEQLLPESPSLTNDELPEFLRILMQTQDRAWLIARMLSRVHNAEQPVQRDLLRMHGYEIMATVLNRWRDTSPAVIEAALSVLQQWPKVTRNKISSSQIEQVVREISEDPKTPQHARNEAESLLQEWRGLSMGYRIPRRKLPPPTEASEDTTTTSSSNTNDNSPANGGSPEESLEPPSGAGINLHRTGARMKKKLPDGWEMRTSSAGQKYYYNAKLDVTSWAPPKDPRDIEREERIRENERRIERKRQLQLQQERERQNSEIQRIIEQVEGPTASASVANSVGSPNSSSSLGGSSHTTPQQLGKSLNSRRSSTNSISDPKKPTLEGVFAAYVPKLVFVYAEKLGRDRCKRHAREIVHLLANKEQAKGTDASKLELTPERKNKIKGFVKDYMNKVAARHGVKGSEKQEHSTANGTPKKIKSN